MGRSEVQKLKDELAKKNDEITSTKGVLRKYAEDFRLAKEKSTKLSSDNEQIQSELEAERAECQKAIQELKDMKKLAESLKAEKDEYDEKFENEHQMRIEAEEKIKQLTLDNQTLQCELAKNQDSLESLNQITQALAEKEELIGKLQSERDEYADNLIRSNNLCHEILEESKMLYRNCKLDLDGKDAKHQDYLKALSLCNAELEACISENDITMESMTARLENFVIELGIDQVNLAALRGFLWSSCLKLSR